MFQPGWNKQSVAGTTGGLQETRRMPEPQLAQEN
jgi:hypothetical protein